MSEVHTYTVHLGMAARDDRHAWEVAQMVKHLVEQYWGSIEYDLDDEDRVFTLSASDYVIDSVNLTDSDDWAEHIPVEDICYQCGQLGGTNRLRVGNGNRWCRACVNERKRLLYPIEEVLI